MPLSQSAFAEMESVRRRSRRLYLPFLKRLYEKSSERRTARTLLSMPGPKKGFVRPLGPFVRAQFGIYRDFSYSLEESILRSSHRALIDGIMLLVERLARARKASRIGGMCRACKGESLGGPSRAH